MEGLTSHPEQFLVQHGLTTKIPLHNPAGNVCGSMPNRAQACHALLPYDFSKIHKKSNFTSLPPTAIVMEASKNLREEWVRSWPWDCASALILGAMATKLNAMQWDLLQSHTQSSHSSVGGRFGEDIDASYNFVDIATNTSVVFPTGTTIVAPIVPSNQTRAHIWSPHAYISTCHINSQQPLPPTNPWVGPLTTSSLVSPTYSTKQVL